MRRGIEPVNDDVCGVIDESLPRRVVLVVGEEEKNNCCDDAGQQQDSSKQTRVRLVQQLVSRVVSLNTSNKNIVFCQPFVKRST